MHGQEHFILKNICLKFQIIGWFCIPYSPATTSGVLRLHLCATVSIFICGIWGCNAALSSWLKYGVICRWLCCLLAESCRAWQLGDLSRPVVSSTFCLCRSLSKPSAVCRWKLCPWSLWVTLAALCPFPTVASGAVAWEGIVLEAKVCACQGLNKAAS